MQLVLLDDRRPALEGVEDPARDRRLALDPPAVDEPHVEPGEPVAGLVDGDLADLVVPDLAHLVIVGIDEREREVLTLLARGYTNQEIAKQLYISVRTAETHRAHVMQKLRLATRAELVSYALANGLLE